MKDVPSDTAISPFRIASRSSASFLIMMRMAGPATRNPAEWGRKGSFGYGVLVLPDISQKPFARLRRRTIRAS